MKSSSYSHIPVIVLMSLLFPVRKVLECGSGLISTLVFCDTKIYSEIEQFDSLENGSLNYANNVCASMGSHKSGYKLHYSFVKMTKFVNNFDINLYDLVLLDDSDSLEDRAATIYNVTKKANRPIILIHDFEQKLYQQAVQSEFRKFVFDTVEPFTAVLWKKESELVESKDEFIRKVFTSFKELIAREMERYQGDSIQWQQFFKEQLLLTQMMF